MSIPFEFSLALIHRGAAPPPSHPVKDEPPADRQQALMIANFDAGASAKYLGPVFRSYEKQIRARSVTAGWRVHPGAGAAQVSALLQRAARDVSGGTTGGQVNHG